MDDEEEAFSYVIHSWHPAQSVTIITIYMLKNALLHELESDYKQMDKSNEFNISVTRAWTVRIFRRLHRFLEEGSLEPYFLPNISILPKQNPRFGTMHEIAGAFCKIITAILEGHV